MRELALFDREHYEQSIARAKFIIFYRDRISNLLLPSNTFHSPQFPVYLLPQAVPIEPTNRNRNIVTDAAADAAVASRALMEAQAGGSSSNRRRRKDWIRNSDAVEGIISTTTSGQNAGAGAYDKAFAKELPDPIVPFESVESV